MFEFNSNYSVLKLNRYNTINRLLSCFNYDLLNLILTTQIHINLSTDKANWKMPIAVILSPVSIIFIILQTLSFVFIFFRN